MFKTSEASTDKQTGNMYIVVWRINWLRSIRSAGNWLSAWQGLEMMHIQGRPIGLSEMTSKGCVWRRLWQCVGDSRTDLSGLSDGFSGDKTWISLMVLLDEIRMADWLGLASVRDRDNIVDRTKLLLNDIWSLKFGLQRVTRD